MWWVYSCVGRGMVLMCEGTFTCGRCSHVEDIHVYVTGSNFNKYLAACESVELIDRTHKQLKRITFVKQQVYSACNQGKYPT